MDGETIYGHNRYRSGSDFEPSSVVKCELDEDFDRHFHKFMMGCHAASDEGESEDANERRQEWAAEDGKGAEAAAAPPLEEADEAQNRRAKRETRIGAKRSASPPPPVVRRPIIIHTYSPKVVQAEKWNFKWVVQSLTGSEDTRTECSRRRPSPPAPSPSDSSAGFLRGSIATTNFESQQLRPYHHHSPAPDRVSNPITLLPATSNLNLNPVHDLFHPVLDSDQFLNFAHFSFH